MSQPSSSAGTTARQPSLRRTNSGRSSPAPLAGSSSSASLSNASATARKSSNNATSTAVGFEEDRGLVMREREREEKRSERDGASVGRAAGVDVGVTRPKRRLSSLPSLPHPFHSSSRALSSSSPPQSPNGQAHHHVHVPPQSTYLSLQSSLSSPSGYNSRMDEKAPLATYSATATREKDGPPRLLGIELKWISLVTLALQNAFLTIIMHYSRISTAPNKTYSAASAVFLNELLKGAISVAIALKNVDRSLSTPSHPLSEKDPRHLSPRPSSAPSPSSRWPTVLHPSRLRALRIAVFSRDCYKLAIPAILYVIQNNLQYVAASNLDVATFQVTYQMKILTTAFFSVVLLRKRLSKSKWASLVLLAMGVAIVQMQTTSSSTVSTPSSSLHLETGVKVSKGTALRSEIPDSPVTDTVVDVLESLPVRVMHPFRGFVAVTLACMTSGLAGVYFEFLLKVSSSSPSAPQPDLWIRNTQLSLFSLVPAMVPIIFAPPGPDGVGWLGRVMASFNNFNGWAIGTVLTQTLGGLITAVVIRYSDNIMKGFATSLSIIISFLASVALFSYPITVAFVLGSSIVLFATVMYNSPSATPSQPSTRKDIAVMPGSPIGPRAPIIGEPEPLRGPRRGRDGYPGPASQSVVHAAEPGSRYQRPVAGQGANAHVYAASAPGTPYLSSGAASVYDGRVSPNFTLPLERVVRRLRLQEGPGVGIGHECRRE
ncbi:hypothetical protein EHS25_002561 [Saitozyma podzolica]|uniref:UDP-galactose transporter n=1 Tax=Saitozyma podzolica TaxID=1890683 RepID=A0A427YCK0_9TREE|nr:hypothetical protein EHS25_002561 [Saitozyma podzolica]